MRGHVKGVRSSCTLIAATNHKPVTAFWFLYILLLYFRHYNIGILLYNFFLKKLLKGLRIFWKINLFISFR